MKLENDLLKSFSRCTLILYQTLAEPIRAYYCSRLFPGLIKAKKRFGYNAAIDNTMINSIAHITTIVEEKPPYRAVS